MDVLVIPEILHLTAAIGKAVSQGHVILVGRSGSGRKQSVKIVSMILNHKVLIPTLTTNFKQSIKTVNIKINMYKYDNKFLFIIFRRYKMPL